MEAFYKEANKRDEAYWDAKGQMEGNQG